MPLVPRLGGPWPLAVMGAALWAGAVLTTTHVRLAYVVTALVLFPPLVWLALLSSQERDALRAWLRAPRRESAAADELL
jgi:hypothetical protein